MEDGRFDDLTRTLARGLSRRTAVKAAAAGLLGALGQRAGADAQASCGNQLCASNPGGCKPGCVCCVYPNGNARCRPPQDCTAPGTAATTTTASPTTTAAPTTTTQVPTTTTAQPTTTAAPTSTTTVPPLTTTTTTTAPADLCAGVTCTSPDLCHAAGTCNPDTGVCSPPEPRIPLETDRNNCGSCGNVCEAWESCSAGVCATNICQAAVGSCFGKPDVVCGQTSTGGTCLCQTDSNWNPICVSPVGGCFPCSTDADCSSGGICTQCPSCATPSIPHIQTYCSRPCV